MTGKPSGRDTRTLKAGHFHTKARKGGGAVVWRPDCMSCLGVCRSKYAGGAGGSSPSSTTSSSSGSKKKASSKKDAAAPAPAAGSPGGYDW
jgi:hypothetical protein